VVKVALIAQTAKAKEKSIPACFGLVRKSASFATAPVKRNVVSVTVRGLSDEKHKEEKEPISVSCLR